MTVETIGMTPVRGVIVVEQAVVDLPAADTSKTECPYSALLASHLGGHDMILLCETQTGIVAIL